MVRPRKVGNVTHKHGNSNETTSSSSNNSDKVVTRRRTFSAKSFWKPLVGFICFSIAVYVSILGYLETRVNTPFDTEKVVSEEGLDVPERYWGTYRPGVYFGLKSREPRSPVFGLMWYDVVSAHTGARHWCDQGDNLATYGWVRHDGVSFGEQFIYDPPHTIYTSFVKTIGGYQGGHWTARINVTAKNNVKTHFMLVWYAALDDSPGGEPDSKIWYDYGALAGYTPQLNKFRVTLEPHVGKIVHSSFSEAHSPGLHYLREKFYSLLRVQKHPTLGKIAMVGLDDELREGKEINFIPIQMLVETPFVLDIVYTADELPSPPLEGEEYTAALEQRRARFDKEFEKKFKLAEKGYDEEDVAVARAAMSNMIGGIGYFYGSSRVQSPYTREPVPYWKAPLYTAVPSRSFFPRGFLWDEGFHGLLIGRWSPDIQMDIAAHWLDLINIEGWIPREQILGSEALARVPKEFVVQSNTAANPPMLLVQLARLVRKNPRLFDAEMPNRKTLERMYPRLKAWYKWFQSSQQGSEPTAYRWRGRHDDGTQLNPKTLTSGLDDYPRASHPSDIERHVDLRCWMFAAADSLATIAKAIGKKPDKFEETRDELADEDRLNELHWSSESETYADYGLHTEKAKLVRVLPKNPNEVPKVIRKVYADPKPQFVASAFGYVSLFPMLLKVLRPESDKLGKILETLDNPNLLWSPYGLRSLSKSSPLYMKRNTEHDPPYWRGQVWININYLALAALKHYSLTTGPHTKRAAELHSRLRANVVRNALSEYKRTGYLWEQYSGEDGHGSGCRPFSGWTALVTLIMAEEY